MMEIVYGPVILACLAKSMAFGLVLALALPLVLARLAPGATATSFAGRIGTGFAGAALFGLAHLAIVCAADGFPPRIIQSTAVALVVLGAVGFVLARRGGRPAAQ